MERGMTDGRITAFVFVYPQDPRIPGSSVELAVVSFIFVFHLSLELPLPAHAIAFFHARVCVR